jgi:hypothetical protein
LGHINGNHEKRRTVEMEDNPEWISAPRTRSVPRKTGCRDGRKEYEEWRAKGSIMERSASLKHQCDRILHLMERLLGGTGIWERNRYNMNNHRHVHILLSLASYKVTDQDQLG